MIAFLKRFFGFSTIPEGWTDDLTIPLPGGRTVDELADFVIQRALQGVPDQENERQMIEEFHLTASDAALVRDRVFGGIVRAATRNIANQPIQAKDPFAFASFQRASNDPSIIASIYPQYASPDSRNA